MDYVEVTPSAPHESSQIYPQLQSDFRMQKVNKISAALNNEVSHYRSVAKKYKDAKKVVNWSAVVSSVLSAAFYLSALLFLLLVCQPQSH